MYIRLEARAERHTASGLPMSCIALLQQCYAVRAAWRSCSQAVLNIMPRIVRSALLSESADRSVDCEGRKKGSKFILA